MAAKRLEREFSDLQKNPSAQFSAEPVDGLFLWKATLIGPPGTPYENGKFHLSISFLNYYPFKSPNVKFITKIYHPCINSSGNICRCFMRSQWLVCVMTSQFLQGLISLLCEPVADDLFVPDVARQFNSDRDKFNRIAKEWTQKYAQDETI